MVHVSGCACPLLYSLLYELTLGVSRLSPLALVSSSRSRVTVRRSARTKDQTTTETVYRHQIRPVVLHGAETMDRIFPEG